MKKLAFFHELDHRFWGDKINTNPYYATISIIIAALLGAFYGGANMLGGMFDWEISINLICIIGTLIFIWGLNVAESICATTSINIMILRSLLLAVCIGLASAIGAVAAVLVICLIILYIALQVIWVLLSGKNSKGKKYFLDDGTEVKKKTGLLGDTHYEEKHGNRRFEDVGNGNVREV